MPIPVDIGRETGYTGIGSSPPATTLNRISRIEWMDGYLFMYYFVSFGLKYKVTVVKHKENWLIKYMHLIKNTFY